MKDQASSSNRANRNGHSCNLELTGPTPVTCINHHNKCSKASKDQEAASNALEADHVKLGDVDSEEVDSQEGLPQLIRAEGSLGSPGTPALRGRLKRLCFLFLYHVQHSLVQLWQPMLPQLCASGSCSRSPTHGQQGMVSYLRAICCTKLMHEAEKVWAAGVAPDNVVRIAKKQEVKAVQSCLEGW